MNFPALTRFGRYVVPFDLPDGPPRGFVFDGDSLVIDVDLPTAARHDWDFILGTGFWRANWRYLLGYVRKKHPLIVTIGIGRYIGLTAGGWVAYWRHRRNAKAKAIRALIEERMVPHADQEHVWQWPTRTWLLADLRRAWPDVWQDSSPDDNE